jgi:hypothetical protein
MSASTLLIQLVDVDWNKESRGGHGATARNRVPESFDIPAAPCDGASVILHKVAVSQTTDFRHPPSGEVTIFSNPSALRDDGHGWRRLEDSLGCTAIRWRDDDVEVRCDPLSGWEPHRRPGMRFTLAAGQWVRAVRNGRNAWPTQGEPSVWTYRKRVVNVGLFRSVEFRAFTSGRPTFEIRQIADLH